MKNYLINLKRDNERLQFQQEQFRVLGLDFERIEACEDDLSRMNRFRWWCAVLRSVVPGEIGCALSHVSVYAKFLREGERCAAVFEDDVKLSPAISRALELAKTACLKDPRLVVLLGDHRDEEHKGPIAPANADLSVQTADWDYCTDSYVIGAEAAHSLLRVQTHVRVPSDYWRYYRCKGWIRLARIVPHCTDQMNDRFLSHIGTYYVAADHGLLAQVWWKARRIVGVVLDCVLDGGKRGW